MLEGLRWLWRHRLFRTLGLMLGILNLLESAVFSILVLFALEILGLSAVGFGVPLTAGAAGSLLGSLAATPISSRVGSGRALLAEVLLLGATSLVVGVSSDAFVVGSMFALSSFMAVVWNVITVSLRQAIIPDRLLGRVNSVYRSLGWGTMPLGALAGGLLARSSGLRAPFFPAAAVSVVMFLLTLPIVNNRTVAEARAAPAVDG